MRYSAAVTQEGELFVAQCLEIDVASQGASEEDAFANLAEAIALHLEAAPPAERLPEIRPVYVRAAVKRREPR